jgi:hypothetical protein
VFSGPGAHQLRVVVTDASGAAASATVDVAVNATASTISVSPATADVEPGGAVTFSARLLDQFGAAMTAAPAMRWSTTGGGTISSTGRYVAGPRMGGPHVVQAVAMGRSGAGAVRIVEAGSLDRTPPALAIGSPTAGQRLQGRVAVEVQVSDAVHVELLVNDTAIDVRTEAPWALGFDASALPAGPARLEVAAFDAAGNRATATVDVLLDDAPSTMAAGCQAGLGATWGWALPVVVGAARRRRFCCR